LQLIDLIFSDCKLGSPCQVFVIVGAAFRAGSDMFDVKRRA
jgi:hypothetical protein